MMHSRSLWLALLLTLAVPVSPALAGTEPVDFSLPRLGGGEVALSDYRGHWVVVNYWATWCAPCRKEIPELSAMHNQRGDVTVLGLAFEDTDDSTFEAFLQEFNVSYPILRVDVYDPPEPFGAPRALPTTILLDASGYAVKTFVGPVTRESIEAFIDNYPATDGATDGQLPGK